MIEEQPADQPNEEESVESGKSDGERLSQAVRRERLAALKTRIGEHAQQDGDVIVVEVGEPVVLHLELDRDGTYTVTWWATALMQNGHHRWRDAAAELLQPGEEISTSALGGGYLVEIIRTTRDEDEVVELAADSARVERVRELMHSFPGAVAALPEEPLPEYLLPPEPELPPLGEADAADVADEDGFQDDSSSI